MDARDCKLQLLHLLRELGDGLVACELILLQLVILLLQRRGARRLRRGARLRLPGARFRSSRGGEGGARGVLGIGARLE